MLESRIRDVITTVRDEAKAKGIHAEFVFHREKSGLIRLGNSSVALSTYEEISRADISVTDGRKTGSSNLTMDITSADQLRQALDTAVQNCSAAIPKEYDPIFGVVEETIDDSSGYDPELENLSAEAKTDLCARVIARVNGSKKYDFSGSWSSGSSEVYFTSTANDKEVFRQLTDGKLVMVLKDIKKKWELDVDRSQKAAIDINSDQIIAHFDKILPVFEANGGYKTGIKRQRVLFGPGAVAELMFLSLRGGMIGRYWEEKRAYTSGNRIGDKIFSKCVSIIDDPENPHVFSMPFDLSGRRRRRFPLIEEGRLTNLIYDSASAAKYGRKPTGHDLPNEDFVLKTGNGPDGLEAAMRAAEHALYIPHLHYVHMPDPSKGLFTCSSRFNAMRIENGSVTAPIFSTRITDTCPSVFNNVLELAPKSVSVNTSDTYGRRSPTAVSVPEYMLCDKIRITDVADSF